MLTPAALAIPKALTVAKALTVTKAATPSKALTISGALPKGVPAAWSALSITASQIVKGSAGYMSAIRCIAGTGTTLTVYDNPWTASGTVLYTGTLSAGESASLSSVPLYCIDGLYASFSGTATFEFQIGE